MQNFKPGTDVSLKFALLNEAGEVLTPTSLSFRVLDEADTQLQASTSVALPGVGVSEVTVVVSAALNALTAPALRAIRTVELEVVTALGTVLLSQGIMLQGATALALGVNTFQTYTQALLLSEDTVSDHIPGWQAHQREDREKAMIEAFNRILLLPIYSQLTYSQANLIQDSAFVKNFGSGLLRSMNATQINALYPELLKALRKAQMLEADDILNNDPVMKARKSGLTSLTVGESTSVFKQSNPLNFSVGDRALSQLQPWVRFSAKIGRQ